MVLQIFGCLGVESFRSSIMLLWLLREGLHTFTLFTRSSNIVAMMYSRVADVISVMCGFFYQLSYVFLYNICCSLFPFVCMSQFRSPGKTIVLAVSLAVSIVSSSFTPISLQHFGGI